MMSKNILLLAAVLASICQPGKRFPNMDKWILADTAKPEKWREVTDEYQYDENGVQAKSTDVKRHEFSGIVSRARGNCSYRSVSTRRDGTAIGRL